MQKSLLENIAANRKIEVSGIVIKFSGEENNASLEGKGYDIKGPAACYFGNSAAAIACVPNYTSQAHHKFWILSQRSDEKLRLGFGSAALIRGFPASDFAIKSVYVTDLFLIVAVLTCGPCDKCAVLNAYKIDLKDFMPVFEDGGKFYKTTQLMCNVDVVADISVLICDLGRITYYSKTGRQCECGTAAPMPDSYDIDDGTYICGAYGDLVAVGHTEYVGNHILRNGEQVCYLKDSTKLHIANGGVVYSLTSGALYVYVIINDILQFVCSVNGCKDIQKRGQYIHLVLDDQSSESYAWDVINQKILIESAIYAVYKRETKEKSNTDGDSAITV